MNDSCEIEVVWDCDSPSSSTWKRIQAQVLKNGDVSPVPQRKYTAKNPTRKISCDTGPTLTQYERSKKEVAKFLEQWQSMMNEDEENSEHSFVPNLDEKFSESESEDDISDTIPLFDDNNTSDRNKITSLDLIFDMSGSGETASFSTPSGNCKISEPPGPVKISDEDWDDDAIFENNFIPSCSISNKEMNNKYQTATSSTPCHKKVAPKRKKIDSKFNNTIEECADIFLRNQIKKNKPQMNLKNAKIKPVSPKADVISEEILSQLIMDDSWAIEKSFSNNNFKAATPQRSNNVNKIELCKNNQPVPMNEDVFNDSDDDMLIEAVEFTESQIEKDVILPTNTKKAFSKSAPSRIKPMLLQPNHIDGPKKCTAEEIERKKLEALRRKNNRNRK